MIAMKKVDLIGLDNEMEDWLMTAIGYHSDYKVEILEAEQVGRGKSFWSNVYEELKGDQEVSAWLYFLRDSNQSCRE
jgi:hypothetical protein